MTNKTYFPHDLIRTLQSVTDKGEFFQYLVNGCRLEQHRQIVQKQCVQQLLVNLYSWLTQKEYFLQQKGIVLNTALSLVLIIGEINTNKQKFKEQVKNEFQYLLKRTNIIRKSSQKQTETTTILSCVQVHQLIQYFEQNVCNFYELYEKVLDHNHPFTVNSKLKQSQPKIEQPQLKTGKLIDLSTLLGLQVLKQYLGQKPPQQDKKQVKKK